jgi:hypothetical protein
MVFLGDKDSPLPSSTMFTAQACDPAFSWVSVVAGASAFLAWFFQRARWSAKSSSPLLANLGKSSISKRQLDVRSAVD